MQLLCRYLTRETGEIMLDHVGYLVFDINYEASNIDNTFFIFTEKRGILGTASITRLLVRGMLLFLMVLMKGGLESLECGVFYFTPKNNIRK